MYLDRKKPRIDMGNYGEYQVKLKRENNGSEFQIFPIDTISEDGVGLLLPHEDVSLYIADPILGILVDRNDNTLARFSGFIVWKEMGKMGIRISGELKIPDQLIAWELSTRLD